MTPSPRICVLPEGMRPHLRDAVVTGGGTLVDVGDAEGLVWTATADVDGLRAALAAGPGIRWVQLLWAGIEPFVPVLDHERLWTCGKGVYAPPVAEHALTLLLAGLHELPRFTHAMTWEPQGGIGLQGARLTIFGAGGITRCLLDLLAPFGCTVTVVRRRPEPLPGVARVLTFEERYEALGDADAVVLACALTDETRGLIGWDEFELMAPHAWLVNVARGGLVSTADLVIALRGDVIGGAALDVTDPEPLPDGHPLWALPNCLITPHTANTESMAVPLIKARVAENVRRFGAGEELIGPVDVDAGY